jgi:Outer membrane protein beta-barrel domain
MMKKLITIILVVLISIPAFSQLKFGIKAGVSTSSLSMGTVKTLTSGTTSYTVDALTTAKYGFNGGVFMRLTIFGLYIQPELLLDTRTNEYTVKNVQTSVSSIVKQNFNKLDIPVMLGIKFGPLRLNAGPSASLLINSPKDLIDSPDFKGMYSKMTVGYQAGLGVDLLKTLTFDIRYEGSLKKYQNRIKNLAGTSVNLDDRANAFVFSLGLFF